MKHLNNKGFTLVELLIAISIISILFFVLIPQVNGFFQKSKESGIRTDFKSFQVASEGYLRETLGNHLEVADLNRFLDAANHVTDYGSVMQTKQEDVWGNPYEVAFGGRRISFLSYGEKTGPSVPMYGIVTYVYDGIVDSCTFGFSTGNIALSKLKNVPVDFTCGNELSTHPTAGGTLASPSDFKTVYVGDTMAVLQWGEVPGASRYIIKRNGVTIYSGKNLTYSDITLTRGMTYTYTVAAKNDARTSISTKLTVTTPLAPPPRKGKGTISDPYILYSAEHLQDMEKNLKAHYALGADIDASPTKSWNQGKGFLPITKFDASLDGRGYSIVDLYIRSDASMVGMIGNAVARADGAKPSIRNLRILNANVTGLNHVGILGGILGGVDISNVHVSGSVQYVTKNGSGGKMVGGLAGWYYGDATNVSAVATVRGVEDVGGVFGRTSERGVMKQLFFDGHVNGTTRVGGVVGYMTRPIQDIQVNATVTGGDIVGGVVGYATQGLNKVTGNVHVTSTGGQVSPVLAFSPSPVPLNGVAIQGTVNGKAISSH